MDVQKASLPAASVSPSPVPPPLSVQPSPPLLNIANSSHVVDHNVNYTEKVNVSSSLAPFDIDLSLLVESLQDEDFDLFSTLLFYWDILAQKWW